MRVTTVHRFPFPVRAGVPINPPGAATPHGGAHDQMPRRSDGPPLETSCRSSARTQDVVFGQVAAPVESRMDHGTSDRDALYQRIHTYIEQNLGDETLGVASLRSMFRLSRATLYVLFENEGGVVRHIRKCRLQAACHYLQHHPECSLTWLLYELGFTNERQFQRAFHACFGVSPARWRRQ
jgi:AraC-like DNA-binding protein